MIPTLEQAENLILEAGYLNPGLWLNHSRNTAKAAEIIASHHPGMNAETAYVFGLLHDIGRREGVTDMRHVIDGYWHLEKNGFEEAANISLTHSFPVKNVFAGAGKWDCSPQEMDAVIRLLSEMEYTNYDRLIQLCDALALPDGFCLMEKRLVDVAMRHGFNDFTLEKWRAYFSIQKEFELAIGSSIYSLLPGVVKATFGDCVLLESGEIS